MAKKIDTNVLNAFNTYMAKIDHHEIYKLHMAQARQTKKMFADDPAMLDKINAIEDKIKDTYKKACLETV
jgi:hypothetical protein